MVPEVMEYCVIIKKNEVALHDSLYNYPNLLHGKSEKRYLLYATTCLNFLKDIYLFLREREREKWSVSGGKAEREEDTESEASSRL